MKIDLRVELNLDDLGRIGPGVVDVPDGLGRALVAGGQARAMAEPIAAPKAAATKSAPKTKGRA